MAEQRLSWGVATSGYRWRVGKNQPDLISLVELDPGAVERQYDPFDAPHLFRVFSSLNPGRQEVLEFAALYGCLRATPEAFDDWIESVTTMQILSDLWDGIQDSNYELLGRYIRWIEGNPAFFDPRLKSPVRLPDSSINPCAGKAFEPGDLVMPAKTYLRLALQDELSKESVTPRILESGSGWRLSYDTPTLLGALWVQFAESIAFDRTFRRCETCKKWFECVLRRDRAFCSATCRVRKSESRRQEAVRLYALGGMTLNQIAREVGSSPAKVKQWISPKA